MFSVLLTIGGVLLCILMCLLFVIFVLFAVSAIKDELIELGWIRDPNECNPYEDEEE